MPRRTKEKDRKKNHGSNFGRARSILRRICAIERALNPEKKKVLFNTNANVSNTGTITNLTLIPQGIDDHLRIGNSVKVLWSYHRMTIKQNTSADQTFLRVLLVADKQQEADTIPAITDVLETLTVESPLNHNTVGRFKILRDKVYTFSQVSSNSKFIKMNLRMSHHMRYNGPNGGDIQKGGLYLMFLSNETTNTPAVFCESRLTYVDN